MNEVKTVQTKLSSKTLWAGLTFLLVFFSLVLAGLTSANAQPAKDSLNPGENLVQPLSQAKTLSVDDFTFSSFEADYYLDRNSEGESVLKTEEKLLAVFPESDQNRGIRRIIPLKYNGWSTEIQVTSVTDETGKPRSFSTETEDGFLVITIRANDYLHGNQHYWINYSQRNVTRHYNDTQADEFYWDVNGDGWKQPFDKVVGRLHLTEQLASQLKDDAVYCYSGNFGSTDPCQISISAGNGSANSHTLVTVSESKLLAEQTVTMAVGFEPGTFKARDTSLLGHLSGWIQGILAAILAFFTAIAIWIRTKLLADDKARGTIIPQYEAPTEASVLFAAKILHKDSKAFAATLLDFAVSGVAKLIEHAGATGIFRRATTQYGLQLNDPNLVKDQGQRDLISHFFFSQGYQPGSVHWFKKEDTALALAFGKSLSKAKQEAKAAGFYRKRPAIANVLIIISALIAVAVFVLGIINSENSVGTALAIVLLIATIPVTLVIVILLAKEPLSAKGTQYKEHLAGLQLYLKVAEADRIRYLYSPTGAERKILEPTDLSVTGELNEQGKIKVIQLHEKLIPYAVLFGIEKEWLDELGRFYAETGITPSWYVGNTAFSYVHFSSAVSSLSSFATSSMAASSSSGGSGGGGSAGGGGGGGGGGGV